MVWYLVRRHLNYGIEQWEALDWVTQRVYLEGLSEEFYEEDPDVVIDDDDSWDNLPAGMTVKRVPAQ
jgi:hypothetical protein